MPSFKLQHESGSAREPSLGNNLPSQLKKKQVEESRNEPPQSTLTNKRNTANPFSRRNPLKEENIEELEKMPSTAENILNSELNYQTKQKSNSINSENSAASETRNYPDQNTNEELFKQILTSEEMPQYLCLCKTTEEPVLTSKENLNEEENEQLETFLRKEIQSFESIEGAATVNPHRIIMKHNIPIKQRYMPRNPAMQEIINEEIDELPKNGRIEPSDSPYSAPIVLVSKKGTSKMVKNPENYPEFKIEEGKLYRLQKENKKDNEQVWKICVPQYLKERVLKEKHYEVTAGHLGTARTISPIKKYYHLPGMVKQIREELSEAY